MFDFNEYADRHFALENESPLVKRIMPRIMCADLFSISAQASSHHYCYPRDNYGPYQEVELGYPSSEDKSITPYAENPEQGADGVFACVPVEILNALIDKHGGAIN